MLLFRIKLTLFLVYIFTYFKILFNLLNYCLGPGLVTDISGRSHKSDCSETVPILISPLARVCVGGGGYVQDWGCKDCCGHEQNYPLPTPKYCQITGNENEESSLICRVIVELMLKIRDT